MSFVNLSPLAFAAGLLAIAGILYLLQQLRTRFNEVTVATTMFWAEAVRDAPVRVLRQRFRHLLAYLLALLIAWLLWLGFADPDRSESSTTSYYVLFLDGSAGSVAGDEFDRSKERLTRYVSGLPRDNREVVFGGSHTVQLLAPGEDAAILERRLNTVSPSASAHQPRSVSRDTLRRCVTSTGGQCRRLWAGRVTSGDATESASRLQADVRNGRLLRTAKPWNHRLRC